jgi:hypothetical protein
VAGPFLMGLNSSHLRRYPMDFRWYLSCSLCEPTAEVVKQQRAARWIKILEQVRGHDGREWI